MNCASPLRRYWPSAALRFPRVLALAALAAACGTALPAVAATVQKRYYAHAAVHDKYGVIAPWYKGQNGQIDYRLRIAAETLKRYPWVLPPAAPSAAPHYVYNGHWKIAPDGKITPVPINNWDNGDLGQRAAYVLSAMVDYYRYSGDPAAIAIMTIQADALLDHCCTPADHPWPNFLISVPVKGKPYGKCDPKGMIQLDIVAEVGVPLLRAYQITGNRRWFEAAKHWGDLLADKRNRTPGAAPWGRYANPECVQWKDVQMTGGVVFLAYFFDELIRLGYTGKNHEIVHARDAARAYMRDVLLPAWTVNDTWGRNYWDWNDPVQAENVTEFAARYMMDHKDAFPNWRNDVRNILSLFLNHTSVAPNSGGEVYSGAWAFPESCGCCGRSLWYGPMELAVAFAQYGVEAQSPWARELARRMQILATYDGHETGVSEDNIDGGFVVNDGWFKIAHPMALKHLLATIAWMPEEFGPARENHIVNSTAVVHDVGYGGGLIDYETFDAPRGTIDTLRLRYSPEKVESSPGGELAKRNELSHNGYTIKRLAGGDFLVKIRHDGAPRIILSGQDTQARSWAMVRMPDGSFVGRTISFAGAAWPEAEFGMRAAQKAEARANADFTGNQVRIVGGVAPDGGMAEVYIDGVKQRVLIDCWSPKNRILQTLYYRNGLPNTEHKLTIVVLGKKNPYSTGTKIYLLGREESTATGTSGFGEGGGPTEAQRMVFGYTGREDIKDSAGNLWRPGTEFIVRLGAMADSVARTWWTAPIGAAASSDGASKGPEVATSGLEAAKRSAPGAQLRIRIAGTPDPELYRYGVHAKEFIVNVTIGPGKYHARLKFAAARGLDTGRNCITIAINGREVVKKMDVAATAGGPNRAVDLVFNDIEPRNGVIDFRFTGGDPKAPVAGEAFVQAIEVGPGSGGAGATPVSVAYRNLLRNAGFEDWDKQGAMNVPAPWKHEGDVAVCRESAAKVVVQPSRLHVGASETLALRGEIAEGSDAVRIAGKGHCRLSQLAAVRPDSPYRASVLIKARDAGGHGFGRTPGDSAGIVLEELDRAGKALVSHPKAAITDAGPFRYVATHVTTGPKTAKLRFILDVRQGCDPNQGSVTLDACVLDGPPALAAITGTVLDQQKKPLGGVWITSGDRSVRADQHGKFSIPGYEDLMTVSVQAAKQGYYPLAHVMRLSAGDNACNFVLAPLPTNNLLVNGDFEQGFAAARSVEHGTSGVRGPWAFRFSPGPACYIYPESIYTWRPKRIFRGKEAVSHVTDGGGELRLFQEVAVDPNTELTASVWVQGLDVQKDGKGFGAAATDFAGLEIEELDAQGRVVRRREKAGIRKATADFQRIATTLTTGPNTAKIRYTLLSHIGCTWQRGAAIFDDCVLEKTPAKK